MIGSDDFDNAPVVGGWILKISTPIGEQTVRLTIAEIDEILSGTATQGTETVPLLDFIVEGSQARWRQIVTKPFPMSISFELAFSADEMSGTCKPGIFPMVRVRGRRTA